MKKENVKKIRLLNNLKEVGIFEQLNAFNNLQIEAKPTDLCLLTGGNKDKLGYTPYWTSTVGHMYHAVITSEDYSLDRHDSVTKDQSYPAIRPVVEIENVPNDDIIYFGEYPQGIETNKEICDELTKLHNSGTSLTGKTYCFDGENEIPEYEYKGSRYVPVVSSTKGEILSDGSETVDGKLYWVKVSPLLWHVDKDTKIMFTKDGILSGIPFWDDATELDLEKSVMYPFLKNKLLRDITNCKEYDEKFDKTINSEDEMKQLMVARLMHLKNLLYNNQSEETIKTIKGFIERKRKLDNLPEDELKKVLYGILYNNITDFTFMIQGINSYDNINKSFIDTINNLLNAVKIKTKENPGLNIEVLELFLTCVRKRMVNILSQQRRYLFDRNREKWVYINSYFNDIFNILMENDPKVIAKALKKFVVYEDKYNDLLIELDLDLGLYKGRIQGK
jgi:hypothetical protein